jgi:integrase
VSVKVRERPAGSGIWWLFIDYQGKRKAKKIGQDKRLALEVAKKIEAKLTLEEFGLDNNALETIPTLRQYVYGWRDKDGPHLGWFDKVAKLSLKNSTQRGYKLILDRYLLPELGGMRLDVITPRMVGDFIGGKVGGGTRSATARNIKNCLSAVMRQAVNPDGYITVNPARGIPVPRPEKEKPVREPDPFTWEERAVFEDTFKVHYPRFYPLVLCGFRTGLRIGELIALQWGDIDFRQKLILVQRNVTRGRITTPKSRAGTRQVRVTSQLAEALRAQRKWLKEITLQKGWQQPPAWVFPNEEGGFLNYGNFVSRIWNKATEKAGMRRRTPHDMRHSYATLRLSKGDSIAEVSKEMGHGTTEITFRTYYKWMPKESRSNIDELDNQTPLQNAENGCAGVAD